MSIKLKTVSALSLTTMANLSAMMSGQALAQAVDIQPPQSLVDGTVAVEIEQQRFLVQELVKRMQTDPVFRMAYLEDPRQAMTSFGLIPEVQREILLEEGLIAADDATLEWECACTGCCVTSINIGGRR